MTINNRDLNTAIYAAKVAGKILRENFGQKYRVIRKSPREMVSEIDMESQRAILEVLNSYDASYGIITEEKGVLKEKEGKTWIIDPLDGTHNYIAGLPFSGISIALVEDNKFYLGVIYFPMEDELYYAFQGRGAFCNGKRVSVSENRDLSKAVINYDNQFYLSEKSFRYYKILTEKAFTTRIFGVAIKDLCLIASGKIDGRIWNSTKICDIAAGIVILTEAGGNITNFDGSPCSVNSKSVIASNAKIHDQLLTLLTQ
ncbi:inositol monophosphatase [bacterium]|nr:inositol monophosphatase [bacterium]